MYMVCQLGGRGWRSAGFQHAALDLCGVGQQAGEVFSGGWRGAGEPELDEAEHHAGKLKRCRLGQGWVTPAHLAAERAQDPGAQRAREEAGCFLPAFTEVVEDVYEMGGITAARG